MSLLATCVALAFVLALVAGGRSFLWCPWMQRTIAKECCHPAQQSKGDAPALTRSNCCETKVVPLSPPASSERAGALQPSAPLLALPARALPRWEGAPSAPPSVFVSARERGARAGPRAPLYELHCAYLI